MSRRKKVPEEDKEIEELVWQEIRHEIFKEEKFRGIEEIRVEQLVKKKLKKAALRAERIKQGGGAVSPYQEYVRQQELIQKRFKEAIFAEVRQDTLAAMENEDEFQEAQRVLQDAVQKPLMKPEGPHRTYSTSLRAPFFLRHFLHPDVLRQPSKHLERFFPKSRFTRHKKGGMEEVLPYEFAMHDHAKELDGIVDDELAEAFESDPRLYYRALTIYERVFALGLKDLCTQLNDILQCKKTRKAWKKYTANGSSMSRFGETELRKVIGGSSNLDQIGHKLYHSTATGALSLRDKLQRFHGALIRPNFTSCVTTYVHSGFLPRRFKHYLAKTWGVSDAWVRNTTLGWRRRLDPFLPVQFREDSVPAAIQGMHEQLKKLLKKQEVPLTTDLELALRLLTKYRLLHLFLLGESLQGVSGLMPKRCWAAAERAIIALSSSPVAGDPFKHHFPNAMTLSPAEFKSACDVVLQESASAMRPYETEQRTLQGIPPASRSVNNLARLKQLSSILSKMRGFKLAVEVLRDDPTSHDFMKKFKFFTHLLPGSRQLFGLAKLLSRHFPKGRKYPVQAALGAIVARACLLKYLGESVKVVKTVVQLMTPANVLTAPFCSKNRTKSLLPLDLLGRNYVIYRELPHGKLHHLLLAHVALGWHPTLTFTLPTKFVKKSWKKIKDAKKHVAVKHVKKKDGKKIYVKTHEKRAVVPKVLRESVAFNALLERMLPLEAPLTDKMIDALEAGAAIQSSRLLPPRPSSYKVTCQLIFGMKKGETFPPPALRFVQEQAKTKKRKRKKSSKVTWRPDLVVPRVLKLKRRKKASSLSPIKLTVELLGADVNRPSKDVLRLATAARALNTPGELVQAVKLGAKIKGLRKRIARVQQAHDKLAATRRSVARLGRVKCELSHLHRRKGALKSALDEEVAKGAARVLITRGTGALAAESLHVDPRGKPKPIAIAVTDMPKREEVLENAVRLATTYHQTVVPRSNDAVRLFRVPAFGTSTYCADCGTKLEPVKGNYDLQYCPTCHKQVNRHENAARNVAIRGQDAWDQFRVSLGGTP